MQLTACDGLVRIRDGEDHFLVDKERQIRLCVHNEEPEGECCRLNLVAEVDGFHVLLEARLEVATIEQLIEFLRLVAMLYKAAELS